LGERGYKGRRGPEKSKLGKGLNGPAVGRKVQVMSNVVGPQSVVDVPSDEV